MTATSLDAWADLDAMLGQAGDPAPPNMAPAETTALARAPAEPAPSSDPRQQAREALNDEAAEAARKAVGLIRGALDAGDADFDDAVRALPALHKIVETYERQEAAKRTGGARAVAILTIVLDDDAIQQPLPRRRAKPLPAPLDVIDL